ncbi:MAG TPA: hypothetical protein VK157_17895 [Phycisphaerales bacterium]|nr:hypothetical protein [Phycisphaerales bacterium]
MTDSAAKPTMLPVPASFGHNAMGIAPHVRFRTVSEGDTHRLCIDRNKTRVAVVFAFIMLIGLFAAMALFGRFFAQAHPLGLWVFVALAAIITPIWLFAFLPPMLAARRLAKSTPVWCELKGPTCVHIAGEPINQPVACVLCVLIRRRNSYISQWQLQLESGEYRLLYQSDANLFGIDAIDAWARATGLPKRSVEIDSR